MDNGIKIGLASFAATAALLLAMPASANARPGHELSVWPDASPDITVNPGPVDGNQQKAAE